MWGRFFRSFNQAELRFLFPSWSLYGPEKASDLVPCLALDQVGDPASDSGLMPVWAGKRESPGPSTGPGESSWTPLGSDYLPDRSAHHGFDRPRDGHEEQTG